MKRLRQLLIATLLIARAGCGAAMEHGQDMMDFTQDWSRGGPLKWLEALRENPRTVFRLQHAPEGWIVEADLAALMAEINSTMPAGTVCYFPSAHKVPSEFQSTIGREAAILVDAFRKRWGYPGNCSDLTEVDPIELQQWWARRSK